MTNELTDALLRAETAEVLLAAEREEVERLKAELAHAQAGLNDALKAVMQDVPKWADLKPPALSAWDELMKIDPRSASAQRMMRAASQDAADRLYDEMLEQTRQYVPHHDRAHWKCDVDWNPTSGTIRLGLTPRNQNETQYCVVDLREYSLYGVAYLGRVVDDILRRMNSNPSPSLVHNIAQTFERGIREVVERDTWAQRRGPYIKELWGEALKEPRQVEPKLLPPKGPADRGPKAQFDKTPKSPKGKRK